MHEQQQKLEEASRKIQALTAHLGAAAAAAAEATAEAVRAGDGERTHTTRADEVTKQLETVSKEFARAQADKQLYKAAAEAGEAQVNAALAAAAAAVEREKSASAAAATALEQVAALELAAAEKQGEVGVAPVASMASDSGTGAEDKMLMIADLKNKVSALYNELKASEETTLLLTKRHELLKRNSKAYKDDVTSKISQLREQLHDKEEEMLQQRLLLGSKARNSADAGLYCVPISYMYYSMLCYIICRHLLTACMCADAGPDADTGATTAAAQSNRLIQSLRFKP